MKKTRSRGVAASQRGVTLIEIMIVLAIIGLIMGVLVGPKVMRAFADAKIKTTFLLVKDFNDAYTRWSADNEGTDCPDKLDDLLRYTNRKDLKDAWGGLLVMQCGDTVPSDSHFGVVSAGPDKKMGTDDDIHSWDTKPKIQ